MNEQTKINEKGAKIFFSFITWKIVIMVRIFYICYINIWKYDGFFFSKKLSEYTRLLGNSE